MNRTKQRIKSAQELLSTYHADALIVEHPTDLYYLTGLEMSAGKLLITPEAVCLLVDGRYIEACQKSSPCRVILLENQAVKNWLSANSKGSTLGFDSRNTSYQTYSTLKKELHAFSMLPIEGPIERLRMIKDDDEIIELRKAAQLGSDGVKWLVSQLREGVTEAELAWSVEHFWKEKGAKKLGFDPIIAFGVNSSMPHYRAGSTPLKKNSPVLLDIGVVRNHYHSDMTRVVFFGDVDPEIKKIYAIVEEAKSLALELCRPGTRVEQLDSAARGYIASQGYGDRFTHNLGHGVGLDIHEMPFLKVAEPFGSEILKPGMVITIEPGIYLPEKGGIRLEDTILITEQGHENLTNAPLSTINTFLTIN